MNQNQETTQITGKIDPERALPDFLIALVGKILSPYSGPTHGCVIGNEVAVAIQNEPEQFYGVPKHLIKWDGA